MSPDTGPAKCSAKAKSTGKRCKRNAITGATVCDRHGGKAPQVAAKAAVVAEVARWRVGDATADPGETLLALLTQSRWRADLYARLLEEAYDAAERLRAAESAVRELVVPEGETHRTDDSGQEHADVSRARQDLDRVFATGGVAALIGNTYAATKDGDVFAASEAIRGLAKLEADERDRCARFAKLALDAGIAERQVRLAEKEAALISEVLRGALIDAGLGDRVSEVLGNAGRRLRALPGGSTRPA